MGDHGVEREAVVVRGQPVFGEFAQYYCLLAREYASVMQLIQHPFDAKRRFVDVLEKEDAAIDLRHIGRADKRHDERQVAAPQRTFRLDRIDLRRVETQCGDGLAQRAPKGVPGLGFELLRTEMGGQHRAAESHEARSRQQRQLNRGEVAVPDEGRAGAG